MVPIGSSVAAAASCCDHSSGLQTLSFSASGVCIVFGPRSVPWTASIYKASLKVGQVVASTCSFSEEAEPQADLVGRSISCNTYHLIEAAGRFQCICLLEDCNPWVDLIRCIVVIGSFVAMVGRCCWRWGPSQKNRVAHLTQRSASLRQETQQRGRDLRARAESP